MNMANLTDRDRLELCRRAIVKCVQWLKYLSKVSDPNDQPLQRFLVVLAKESERNSNSVNELADLIGDPPECGMEEKGFDPLLRSLFPSMRRGVGEGYLGRELGMHFAECIEEELARFYQSLAEGAEDPEVRSFLVRAGKEEASHLETVRHLLLK